jgi:uncharacterized membrane protein YoaK (UPF0700 family)
MFEMFMDSATLFMKGKLFQDYKSVFTKMMIGVATTAGICVILAKLGLSILIAITIAAFIGGALQPYLFKDLKYN